MTRDINFYIQQDRSHILPNIISGAKAGIISQFVSDIVISLLLYNETIVINDIKISEVASYYASTATGITSAVLAIYLDPFAIVLFASVVYEYVFNLISSITNSEVVEFGTIDVVFDSIVTIILIYCFDPVAHNQYIRYKEKRHLVEPTHKRMNRSLFQTIFFIVLSNTYTFFKNN